MGEPAQREAGSSPFCVDRFGRRAWGSAGVLRERWSPVKRGVGRTGRMFAAALLLAVVSMQSVPQSASAVTATGWKLPWRSGEHYLVSQSWLTDPADPNSSHAGRYAYDFVMPVGTPILAAKSGTVKSGTNDGIYIKITHDSSTVSTYGHLSKLVVTSGYVVQGQLIGFSGNTGVSTGPHLHFEVSGKFYFDEYPSKTLAKNSYAYSKNSMLVPTNVSASLYMTTPLAVTVSWGFPSGSQVPFKVTRTSSGSSTSFGVSGSSRSMIDVINAHGIYNYSVCAPVAPACSQTSGLF